MKSEVLNKEFDFKVLHIGLFVDDNLWQYDKWTVVINGQTFDYHTGIGHRKPKKGYLAGGKNWHGYKNEATYFLNGRFKQDKHNLKEVNKHLLKLTDVNKPKIDDVLYSLIIDSDALNDNFFNWCDNFGYDSDSRKALKIYEDCVNNGRKVEKFIPNLDEARELFQDY